ncbi:hypothetical protein [Nocardiopsis sp. NRRL B-16309]|uniref:baeRF2 domain-containing protein n=1 Tax=Nocardiopsis sp. NRRL B-16309 TaxID=1519494 RepID=UPI0006AF2536|nr:hypothetical protein [Nocardiopsis sp. NRRL B-16309]KOX15688.1 hypothetical protein ADL05_13765 [Nocardiopsis sp. NRRL B-16309]
MDLGFLRPLYESDSLVASVHLDTSRDTTDADRAIELRWRHLRDELAELGTDEATLDALAEAVVERTSRAFGSHGQALFASEGQLLDAHTLAVPPQRDSATWMPVPDVLPLVVDRDRRVPYVLVALDRVHAKVFGYPAHPTHGAVSEDELTGEDTRGLDVETRSGPGNRSGYNGRFANKYVQQELWRENTAAVAERIREAVAQVGAEVILVGGDDEAIAYLRENLGERRLTIPVRHIAGGRGGTDAEDRLHEAAEQALREFVVEKHDAFLADYQEKLAHDQAVKGTYETLPMLSEKRVETLVLGADRSQEPHLWGSVDEPSMVTSNPSKLGGPDSVFKAPASAVMLRSAVMGHAAFTEMLDHGEPSGESGATLRFPK